VKDTATLGNIATVSFDPRTDGQVESFSIVSVSPEPRSQIESYQATSVLQGQELALQMRGTLAATLDSQPGMAERSFGPAPARPVIRGMDGDRVLILEDGKFLGSVGGGCMEAEVWQEAMKVMAGGGAMSPSDEIDTSQYSLDELKAAVWEAESAGKYVAAHCYSDRSILNTFGTVTTNTLVDSANRIILMARASLEMGRLYNSVAPPMSRFGQK
jgi:hypothetical protein